MQKIILASQSPNRRQLLAAMGVKFDVVPSEYEEEFDESRDHRELAQELALGKALDVANKHPDALVIGADTFAVYEGRQIGKPHTPEKALETLRMLNGQTHEVVTGIAMVHAAAGKQHVRLAVATVTFKQHPDERLQQYVATGDPLDKSGAYGLQNKGGFLPESIDGDEDAIVGLPTQVVANMLDAFTSHLDK
jgi:septum formation protein